MIPNQEKTVNIQGSSNLGQARSQQMGIDSASLPHLMKVLTNLYSDPEMAVIREISTNAYDSHVEAGKGNVPIQVTLPNVFSPEFVVKDFGVGMSETEVFEVFGLYGASTKRESNDYVGQLGLGCKSPLTLTNQFSLTATKNGVKCIFSVHLDEMGIGKITKLHEENTDEGNGVEVSVPVSNTNSFIRKARRFYRFFPVMPKFTGQVNFPEEMVPQTLIEIDDTTRVIKSIYDDENHDFVIMGGVAYPYRSETGYRRFRSGTVVMEAPIGAVDFTPSREELHLTGRTKSFIENRYKKVEEVFATQVQAKLDAAKDVYEFQRLLTTLSMDLRSAGIHTARYNGVLFDVDNGERVLLPKGAQVYYLQGHENRLVDAESYYTRLTVSNLDSTAFAENDTKNEEMTSYTRTRVKMWMELNRLKYLVVLPTGVDFTEIYLDKVTDGGNITEIRKNANKLIQKKVSNGLYELVSYSYGTLYTNETKPDTSEYTVVYAPRQVIKGFDSSTVSHFSNSTDKQLFVVNKSKKAEFLAEYPDAVQVDRYFLEYANGILDKVTDPVDLAIHNKGNYGSAFSNVSLPYSRVITNTARLEDEELKAVLDFIDKASKHRSNDTSRQVNAAISTISGFNQYSAFARDVTEAELMLLRERSDKMGSKEAKEVVDLIRRMQAKYPIILHQHTKEDYLIEYANMIAKGA